AQPMNPSRTDQAGRALPPERARVMGYPARAMAAWVAAAYWPGGVGPDRPAERLGRRCGRPSPANGAAPQDTPLIPGLACAASQADALRPPAAVTQLPVTAATAALADGRRLPAAGHRTPALPVPLLRTPASRPAIRPGPPV